MQWIKDLHSYKNNIDAIQVAEILWLSKIIGAEPNISDQISTKKNPTNTKEKKEKAPTVPKEEINDDLHKEVIHEIIIHQGERDKAEHTFSNTSNSQALTADLVKKEKFPNLIEQLKELMLKQNVIDKNYLDDAKTVNYLATTGLLNPIFKKTKKRISYLKLNLVIDSNESMMIWQEQIKYFSKRILVSKIFKEVNIFLLDTSEDKVKLYNESNRVIKANTAWFKDKQSLTLLLTDVIGMAWKNNSVFNDLLNYWVNGSFVTIVSMLPQRHWEKTPLRQGSRYFMYSNKFMPKNSDLKVQYSFIEKELSKNLKRIPVISFEEDAFEYLSSILTAKKDKFLNAYLFDDLPRKTIIQNPIEEESKKEIKERIERFLSTVLADTGKLAIYCAVLPLHKDIIKEVIRVKGLGNVLDTFAEFTFGGLLDKSRKNKYEYYNFYDGVREELFNYINMSEIESIYRILDSTVKQSLGIDRGFIDILHEKDNDNCILSDKEKELVDLLLKVLKVKGEVYYKTDIKRLTQKINTVYPEKNWFMMGSEDGDENEKPIHKVIFNYDFEIAKFPVTFEEYDFYCEDMGIKKPYDKGWGRGKRPVINVNIKDIGNYCDWLNIKHNITWDESHHYRIPTEAEWEYASRTGMATKWSFGDNEKELEKYAWYDGNGGNGTKEVGTKEANLWEIHDMYGNVWEWCLDTYEKNYQNTPIDGSEIIDNLNSQRILRGGSWSNHIKHVHSAYRNRNFNSITNDKIGFRILRTLPKTLEIQKQIVKNLIVPDMIKIIHPKPEKSFKFPMIKVPLGTCTMYHEFTNYNIEVINNFEIGKLLVTFNEYDLFCEDTGFTKPKDNGFGRGKKPVINVSWYDAIKYCKWLSKKSNNIYRLPYKAEWIYACRAGTNSKWSFGDNIEDLDKYAWYENNSNKRLHDVGLLDSNNWGLHDCHGLVKEWCEDWFDEYKDIKNVCGGSWIDQAHVTEIDGVDRELPEDKYDFVGFRIVKVFSKAKTYLVNNFTLPKILTPLSFKQELYIGREEELNNLDKIMNQFATLMIKGIAGIGKTSLVKEYLSKNQNKYDYIAYLSLENNFKDSIVNTFGNITNSNDYDYIISTLTSLKGNKILVIDNIDESIKGYKIIYDIFISFGWKIIFITRESSLILEKIASVSYTLDVLKEKDVKKILEEKLPSKKSKSILVWIERLLPIPLLILLFIEIIKTSKMESKEIFTLIDELNRNYNIDNPNIEALSKFIRNIYSSNNISYHIDSPLKTDTRWWGNWEVGKNKDLFITKVDKNGFYFELSCINELDTGDINGYAKFISPNEAQFEVTEEDETCRLSFHKTNESIQITEENCSSYHGMQVHFDGQYKLKNDIFVKYNKIVDDRVLSDIYGLIGKNYWERFQQCFAGIRGMNDLDNLGIDIIVGTISNPNPINESILMIDADKNIWGAFINDEDDKVYYFASLLDWKNTLPKTVDAWRENFKEKELVFIDNLSIKDNVYQEFDNENKLENDTTSKVDDDYNLLIIDTNLEHLNIIKNAFTNKGFNSDRVFPRSIESEKFISDIRVLARDNKILKIQDYIIQIIKNFNIDALIIEPILGDEEINHPNDAIGSKVIAELEKIDEYKKLPILVLSQIRKYAIVDNLIISDNILLAEKPYVMNQVEVERVLDEEIIDDLTDGIIEYLDFKTTIRLSEELTLSEVKENFHDEILKNLLEIIDDEFKDYSLDADYLPDGIDEVRITELYMPEELKFTKLIKNDDTYILNIEFETEAFVWMLVDRNHHDYMSLKPLPVRDHNKQYYNAEVKENLYIELSVEFKIEKNEKITDLVIDSIDDVVLIEGEHSDEREQDIKDAISDEITHILKTEHLKGLDFYQIHDESLPSDDSSALINSFDLPKKVDIEDIEIFSNRFDAKVYLEQEVYLDIHILKSEYYSNDEYVSLYGAVEDLNKHYVTVEGHALISMELNIQGTRDKDIDSIEDLDIDIIDIIVVEQIPMNKNIDNESIQEIKDWFFDNYKKTNAFPATFPIKFGEKKFQNYEDVKDAILAQFEEKYSTNVIKQVIIDIKEEYGDVGWTKKPNNDNNAYVKKGYFESDEQDDVLCKICKNTLKKEYTDDGMESWYECTNKECERYHTMVGLKYGSSIFD